MLRLTETELVNIIKEEICYHTNINEGIVKEYLDKYFASNLKKYLHMTPEEKKGRVLQRENTILPIMVYKKFSC